MPLENIVSIMAKIKCMKKYIVCILILLFFSRTSQSTILDRTSIIIMSQKEHDQSAMKLRDHLNYLLKDAGVAHPKLLLLHKDLPIRGSWTIFPILSNILHRFETSIDWYVFLDERSSINSLALSSILDSHNASKKVFLGRSIQDKHASKIHHFEKNFDLKYPNFSAGFVLSRQLVADLVAELKEIAKIHIHQDVEHFPRRFNVGKKYRTTIISSNQCK